MTALEIEAFQAALRWGSLSAAAEKLYVTQPALSRRIHALERELGARLFVRGKGQRQLMLTPEGRVFVGVADKLRRVYEEAAAIARMDTRPVLRVASVGSVSTYLLPDVLRRLAKEHDVGFHLAHSYEGYQLVASGMADVALISDDMVMDGVTTEPLFAEPFMLICCGGNAECAHPSRLNARREIRLPWNPEFDVWHAKWFDVTLRPSVVLDQMSLMEAFFDEGNWALAPKSVASRLRRDDLRVCPIEDGPPHRVIYALTAGEEKRALADDFLRLVIDEVRGIGGTRPIAPCGGEIGT